MGALSVLVVQLSIIYTGVYAKVEGFDGFRNQVFGKPSLINNATAAILPNLHMI